MNIMQRKCFWKGIVPYESNKRLCSLNTRESQVLKELINDLNCNQIADKLNLSNKSVYHYISNIKIKLLLDSKISYLRFLNEVKYTQDLINKVRKYNSNFPLTEAGICRKISFYEDSFFP
ncbi:hypothetical protein KCK33_004485 [Salmonella enterica]|nr:hypothetical protein [Salmonella enterica]EHD2148087.1 hypothetical protein [Salmonella enterica]EHK2354308.1 hypothetical protein [Salmonella enterica]